MDFGTHTETVQNERSFLQSVPDILYRVILCPPSAWPLRRGFTTVRCGPRPGMFSFCLPILRRGLTIVRCGPRPAMFTCCYQIAVRTVSPLSGMLHNRNVLVSQALRWKLKSTWWSWAQFILHNREHKTIASANQNSQHDCRQIFSLIAF